MQERKRMRESEVKGGFAGRLLYVDLGSGEITVEGLPGEGVLREVIAEDPNQLNEEPIPEITPARAPRPRNGSGGRGRRRA